MSAGLTPEKLIDLIYSTGGHLVVDGEVVKYSGPRSLLTPALRDDFEGHRAKIRDLLAVAPVWPWPRNGPLRIMSSNLWGDAHRSVICTRCFGPKQYYRLFVCDACVLRDWEWQHAGGGSESAQQLDMEMGGEEA